MTRVLTCFVLFCAAAFSQAPEPARFEVADVHISPKIRNAYLRGPAIRGGRYEIHTATMVDLIGAAYGVKNAMVLGGPSWLETLRFDVIAKAPAGSKVADLKPQLQALLAERFKLVVHNDTKPIAAWALTAGKHQTLKKAEPVKAETTETAGFDSDRPGANGCQFVPPTGPQQGVPPLFVYKCRNITMAKLADTFDQVPASFQIVGDLPVVDKTDLPGSWDFDLQYNPRNGPPVAPGTELTYLPDAIEKQLGLKLEPAKVPLPVLVVDSVSDKPTPNAPDLADHLHVPIPAKEFEVADIKLTNPDFKGGRFQIQPGGRVNIQGLPLKQIVEQIWEVRDETLIGWPKNMDDARFDVIAKMALEPDSDNFVDFETVISLLKTLIQDRFKLAAHMDERPIEAYTLFAVKPKMAKADPNSRTRNTEGPGPDGKDPRIANPALGRLLTLQNTTMADFAEQLQYLAGGYVHSAVLDKTGLEGGYDFTLSFSPIQTIRPGGGGRGGDAPAPNADNASDPSGGITLPDAIDKQLGLKLVQEKRPVQVLVIDHIEPKPTDN